MADLLPCPFCGGNAELDTRRSYRKIGSGDLDDAVAVYCLECTADHMACRADHIGLTTDDLVDMVSAAWNRRAPIAGWRDMKDAPKDGTRILLGCFATELRERLGHTAVDYWHSLIAGDNFDGWGRFNAAVWPPTHWMPLPAAPVDGGEDA